MFSKCMIARCQSPSSSVKILSAESAVPAKVLLAGWNRELFILLNASCAIVVASAALISPASRASFGAVEGG